ncbi:MAG: serine/threonine protein kinase [Ruminococcaceae bacterium]|nr:serine/threonine protein kinase [Oscillospiraceae bacterium]
MDNKELFKTIIEIDDDATNIDLSASIEYEPDPSGGFADDGKTVIDSADNENWESYAGNSGFTFEVEGLDKENAETPLSNHLHPGMTLKDNRYKILKVVGAGGFGVVYKAFDSKLNIDVAIKELYPSSLVNRVPGEKKMIIYGKDNARQYAYLLDRFILEARSMAKFNSVKNIVNIFDCFQENNTAYIVMEFIKGKTLEQYVIDSGGKLSVERATELMNNILDGLAAIHAKGIIHRDIKPKNIFITEDGELKIIDFGAARFSSTEEQVVTRYSKVLTPGFAPPEQYRKDSKQGPYTDIYAASAVYYYMVTGVIPEISVDRVVNDDIRPLSEVAENVPECVERAISRSLELNSDLRLQTAAEVKSGLNGQKLIRYVAEEKKMRFRRRIIIIAATAALLLFAAVGVVVYKMAHAQDITIDGILTEDTTVSISIPLAENGDISDGQLSAWGNVAQSFEAYISENSEKNVKLELKYLSSLTYDKDVQANPTDIYFSSDNSEAPEMEYITRLISAEDTMLYSSYMEDDDAPNSYIVAFDPTVLYVNEKLLSSIDRSLSVDDFRSISDILSVRAGDDVKLLTVNPVDQEYYLEIARFDTDSYFTPLDEFCMGNVLFYIGHLSDNFTVSDAMPGFYAVSAAPDVEDIRAIGYEWQINGDSEENQVNAAQLLLSYITGEDVQDALFVQTGHMIPVNPIAYEKFMEYNPDFSFIADIIKEMMPAEQ